MVYVLTRTTRYGKREEYCAVFSTLDLAKQGLEEWLARSGKARYLINEVHLNAMPSDDGP